jgi:YVTN family beta-propeller protein
MNSYRFPSLTVLLLVSCFLGCGPTLAQNAYVPNFYSSNVSVIDTQTNTVTATIPVGANPVGVAAGRDRIFVTNLGDGTVSVIDAATNTVVATINDSSTSNHYGGFGIAVTPDGSKVYVAATQDRHGGQYRGLSVIQTTTNAITQFDCGPCRGVAVSSDGSKYYVPVLDAPSVAVYDTGTNDLIDHLPIGYNALGIAVSHDGTRLYAANWGKTGDQSTVSVVDLTTGKDIAIIPADQYPLGVAVSPGGAKVYVATGRSNTVWVIDAATNTVAAKIPVGTFPQGVAISPDGMVYVANQDDNSVSVINPVSKSVVNTIRVGTNPVAFGSFIQPGPLFAGTPRQSNCISVSVATLSERWGSFATAAIALGYRDAGALRDSIGVYCRTTETASYLAPRYPDARLAKRVPMPLGSGVRLSTSRP